MHELKHYQVDYHINGHPAALTLDEFNEPTFDQVRLRLLHKHTDELRVVEDAPWEQNLRSSLDRRADEVGLSDIHIHLLD